MNDSANVATPMVELEMRRDYTPERVNAVINHPDVLPWMAPEPLPAALDFGPLIRDLANIVLFSDKGGAIFMQLDETCYELHTQFLSGVRGRPVVRFMHRALEYIFTHTNCMEVVTKVPIHNAGARALAQHFHFVLEGTRDSYWNAGNAGVMDVEFYSYKWSDWLRHSPLLATQGAAFHSRLDNECARLGLAHESHAPEGWHDRVVGATLATAYAGLVDKAAILYNRWAKFAGYATVRVVSRLPPVVEFETQVPLRLVLDPVRQTFEVVPPVVALANAGVL
jgi:hypothetical protein